MKGLQQTIIPVATNASTKLDLSCDHVTTMDFGVFQPVHYRHPIKGEHLNLSGAGTVRPFPLACPTFGRMRCNIHHFYVPWRIVFPQFESFYNENIAVNFGNVNMIDSAPFIKNSTIADAFTSPLFSSVISGWTLGDPYDWFDGTNHYQLSSWGKFVKKILNGLGYEINFDNKDTVELSALPLLAYCKIFLDYYANQAYLNSSDVLTVRQLLSYNDPTTPLEINTSSFLILLNLIKYCQYEQDYYVGAWDNPFAPAAGQYSAITFQDVATGASIVRDGDGTPVMQNIVAGNPSLGTQYLHDALKAITDYSKRHQLAGASNLNRVLAQYGFGVKALQLDRAIHLQGSSIDIQTGAVFSTANTASGGQPSTLGDYAGNGYGNGVSSFDFKVEELGIQITIASIMPSGGYFQGMDENNMHVHRFDFHTPEFDGLATQIIRKREVYVSRNGVSFYGGGNAADYDKAFGHVSRYGEYKRPRSWVTGDFRVPTRFRGGDAWHLMREFDDSSFGNAVSGIAHSLQFTLCSDNNQYRRIFIVNNTDHDPFYAEFHWAVGAYAPCHGLFDNYDFDSDTSKKVTLESNGAIVN